MKFEQNLSTLFEDMQIPEFFMTEYFCNANGDYVKIYLYSQFLCKHGSEISALDLSKKLSIPLPSVEAGLSYWEEQGLFIKKNKVYELADLKKIAVNKLYTPRLSTSPEDAIKDTERNILRTQAVNEINTSFFQGVMSPTWFALIDTFFNKYSFDEDVMVALFRYCYDRQALHRNYIQTVADGWANSNIKTMNDLEKYYLEQEQLTKAKKTIKKKLGYSRNFNEFEEAIIEKWVKDFEYPIEVLDIAFKKTTSKATISFEYLDKIVTDWHERNLHTTEEITNYTKEHKQKAKEIKAMMSNTTPGQISMQKYFDNNGQYSDIDQYYANL